MRVVLAQPRGFCAGVVRAIDVVEGALEQFGAPVYVRHEIVHNKHVVEALRNKGARFVEELSEVPDGALTIFSAHGVSQAVVNDAAARKLPVIDATCPLVSKVHSQGKRYVAGGRTLVLIGHAGHPEVEGTMGQVGRPTYLVSSEADVAALDLPKDAKIAYVTQTTLSIDDTRSIIGALHRKFSDVVGPNTSDICYATQNRQSAVRELSKIADIVPSYLIADASELDVAWLAGKEVIGLTAGASAPEKLVQEVIEALRAFDETLEVEELDGKKEHITFRLPAELRV